VALGALAGYLASCGHKSGGADFKHAQGNLIIELTLPSITVIGGTVSSFVLAPNGEVFNLAQHVILDFVAVFGGNVCIPSPIIGEYTIVIVFNNLPAQVTPVAAVASVTYSISGGTMQITLPEIGSGLFTGTFQVSQSFGFSPEIFGFKLDSCHSKPEIKH
jgi:hypothetical protein